MPYGYARGWEPVLYVNNIRAYYNIIKWLTENEEQEEVTEEDEIVVFVTDANDTPNTSAQ